MSDEADQLRAEIASLRAQRGCGVEIISNQDERDERFRRELIVRDEERKRWRAR